MMKSTDMQAAFGNNLPAQVDPSALMRSAKKLPKANGAAYLKFADAEFTIGKERDPVDDDQLFAVNAASFMFGMQEWFDGEAGASLMKPAGADYDESELVLKFPDDVNHHEHKIAAQVAFDLHMVPDGRVVSFNSSTRGGTDAVNDLCMAIGEQAQIDIDKCVAVIKCVVDSYPHKKRGKIYIPKFVIVRFDDVELSETLGAKGKAKKAPKKKKASKAKVSKAPPARTRRS